MPKASALNAFRTLVRSRLNVVKMRTILAYPSFAATVPVRQSCPVSARVRLAVVALNGGLAHSPRRDPAQASEVAPAIVANGKPLGWQINGLPETQVGDGPSLALLARDAHPAASAMIPTNKGPSRKARIVISRFACREAAWLFMLVSRVASSVSSIIACARRARMAGFSEHDLTDARRGVALRERR